jgi:hypothetical protein
VVLLTFYCIYRYKNKIEEVFNLTKKEAMASAIFWGFVSADPSIPFFFSTSIVPLCMYDIVFVLIQTGLSGNLIVLLVLYYGGNMISLSQITVGGLTSFTVYAAWVGVSVGGEKLPTVLYCIYYVV